MIIIDKESIIKTFAVAFYAVSGGDYSAVKNVVKELLEKIDYESYEERPTGYWKALGFVHSRKYAWCTCSNCGKTTMIYLDNNDFCCIADIRNKAVACLYCGADMRGGISK